MEGEGSRGLERTARDWFWVIGKERLHERIQEYG